MTLQIDTATISLTTELKHNNINVSQFLLPFVSKTQKKQNIKTIQQLFKND